MRFCIIPPRTCQSTLVVAAHLHNIQMILAGAIRQKAINLPSGDQVGSSLSKDSEVSLRGSPPSAEIVNIAKRLPTRPV